MLTDKEYSLIERYFDHGLNSIEREEFKIRLQSDEEFKNETQHQETLITALKNRHENNLRKQLKESLSKQDIKVKHNHRFRYYSIAASITIGLLFLSYYFFFYQNKNTEEIFISYFEVFPITPATRDDSDSLNIGILLYQSGDFTESLRHLIPSGNMNDPENEFNLAIGSAYLALGKSEESISWFEINTKSTDNSIQDYAEWYIALAHLSMGSEKTVSLFDKIVESNSPYKNYSKRILEDLQ